MIIYMITNKINNKSYIGQTKHSLKRRKSGHIHQASKKKSVMYISRAIKKYGKGAFNWEVIHDNITDIDFLNRLEIFYIGYYNTLSPGGYNLALGGNGHLGPTYKTKQKISKTLKSKHIKNEWLSNRNKTRLKEKHPMYGKKHTAEAKKMMSLKLKGTQMGSDNPAAKPVIINGNYFETIVSASRFLGVSATTVSIKLKNKISGYKYSQKED